jgi:histidine triad (HIT) family protein
MLDSKTPRAATSKRRRFAPYPAEMLDPTSKRCATSASNRLEPPQLFTLLNVRIGERRLSRSEVGWASTVRSVPVDPECIFCGIVAGEIPSMMIAETERAIAFMDINPATHGHVLVIPRTHATDLLDIAADDLAACAHLAQEIARRAKNRLGASGVNLLNCCGVDAWQSVFHFHFHVIPRFKDQPAKDSVRLPWDPVPGDLEQIGRIGSRLS